MEEDKDQYFSSLVRKGNKIHMMYGNKKVWDVLMVKAAVIMWSAEEHEAMKVKHD